MDAPWWTNPCFRHGFAHFPCSPQGECLGACPKAGFSFMKVLPFLNGWLKARGQRETAPRRKPPPSSRVRMIPAGLRRRSAEAMTSSGSPRGGKGAPTDSGRRVYEMYRGSFEPIIDAACSAISRTKSPAFFSSLMFPAACPPIWRTYSYLSASMRAASNSPIIMVCN